MERFYFIFFFVLYNLALICLNSTNYHAQTILHTVNMAGNPQQRHRPLLRPQLTFKTIKVNYYKGQERFTNSMTAVQ